MAYTKKDVPKVLLYTKIMTYIPFTIGLVACYKYRPAKIFVESIKSKAMIQYIKNRWPTQYKKTNSYIQTKLYKISESKVAMYIPKFIGLRTKRFTKSFVESIILYKMSLPLTLPLCFFGSLCLDQNMIQRLLRLLRLLMQHGNGGGIYYSKIEIIIINI
jgi:hypothetical protein